MTGSQEVDIRDEDVIDLLVADHEEVTDTLNDCMAASDPEEKRQLADIAIAALVRHSVAEETIVYPAMRHALDNGEEAVDHDVEEHKALEVIMKKLEGIDAADPEFDSTIRELLDNVTHHADDEEQEQFPQLRETISRDQLVLMAKEVAALKKIAPTRPHPSAPNNALFHMLAGPGVGLVDRLRDRLSGRVTSDK